LKTVSRSRSDVGRMDRLRGEMSFFPRSSPPMTLTCFLLRPDCGDQRAAKWKIFIHGLVVFDSGFRRTRQVSRHRDSDFVSPVF
jgi:hypothetical protein